MSRKWALVLAVVVILTAIVVAPAQVFTQPNSGVHTNYVVGVAFSETDELVTVGLDKVAYRWDLSTGKTTPIRFAIGDFEGLATAVATGPGRLAIGLFSKLKSPLPTVLAVAGEKSIAVPVPPGVGKIAWSPNGESLAGIAYSESVVCLDMSGRIKWTVKMPGAAAELRKDPRRSSLSFSPDGQHVFVSFFQYPAKSLWRLKLDASTGKQIGKPESVDSMTTQSVTDSLGNVVWVDADGTVKWWKIGQSSPQTVGPKGEFGETIALSPNGKSIAVSFKRGVQGLESYHLYLCDFPSGTIRNYVKSETEFTALAFSQDSAQLAAVKFPCDIITFQATDGRLLKEFARSGAVPVRMSWAPIGDTLLWSSNFADKPVLGLPIRATRSFDFSGRSISTAPNASIPSKRNLELKWDATESRVRARLPGTASDLITSSKILAELPPVLYALSDTVFAAVHGSPGKTVDVFKIAEDKTSIDTIARISVPVTVVTSLAIHPTKALLAIGATDQQIRMYLLPPPTRVRSEVPNIIRADLALITSNSGDWVVYNEDNGFYDSSPSGDSLIGFQRQEGGKVEFTPVASLANQFRKPGLIQEILGGKRPSGASIPPSSAMTQIQKVPGLDVIDVRGTKLVRGAMSETDVPMWQTDKGEVEIVVDVSDAINKNDIQVANGTGGKSAGDGLMVEVIEDDRFVVRTKLYPGQNKIRVWANTRNGKTAEDLIEVERTGGTPKNDWNVFVLAVPEFNKLPALPAVQQDGQQVADFFRAQNGKGGQVNVKQVPTQKTSTKEIIQQLDEFTNSVKEGESVLMYISSHGLPDEQGRYFIASKDIDTQNAQQTGIDWSQVQDRLAQMNRQGARYVVLIVDSCFAGQAIAGRAVNPQANEPAMSTMRALQGNTVLVTSSMPGQKSWTLMPEFLPKSMSGTKLPAQGMSLFTHALLRGLKGELGAQDAKGRIKLSTLFAFVSQEVATVVKKYQEAAEGGEKADFRQVRQDPWRSPFDDDIVIAQVPAR